MRAFESRLMAKEIQEKLTVSGTHSHIPLYIIEYINYFELMANLSLFYTFFKYCSRSSDPSFSVNSFIHTSTHRLIVSSYLLKKISVSALKKRGLKRMEESKVTESKVTVMKRSMSDEVFDEAMKLTANAFASQENDKDIAEHIKTQLEKKFHGSWYVFFSYICSCLSLKEINSLNRSENKNIST